MNTGYQPLDQDDQKLFQYYSNGVDKAVRETFSSIPASFQLQPVSIQKQMGCDMFYGIKVALPDGKFAKVSFHTGGYLIRRAPGEKEPEQRFDIDPTPSSSQND